MAKIPVFGEKVKLKLSQKFEGVGRNEALSEI